MLIDYRLRERLLSGDDDDVRPSTANAIPAYATTDSMAKMNESVILTYVSAVSSWVRNHVVYFTGPIGILVGLGFSVSGRSRAETVAASSPELAVTGFRHAIVSNHSGSWLFYHYPITMTAIMVLIWGMVGVGFGLKR